jgi:hypothetical protein
MFQYAEFTISSIYSHFWCPSRTSGEGNQLTNSIVIPSILFLSHYPFISGVCLESVGRETTNQLSFFLSASLYHCPFTAGVPLEPVGTWVGKSLTNFLSFYHFHFTITLSLMVFYLSRWDLGGLGRETNQLCCLSFCMSVSLYHYLFIAVTL